MTLESIMPSNKANIVIAAYITTIARLKLYSYLAVLGERAIYFDTDSVIFTQEIGEAQLPIEDSLGDLTVKVTEYGEGSYIGSFASGEHKNYDFRIQIHSENVFKTVCKVKDNTQDYKNAELINFESIQSIIVENTTQQTSLTIHTKYVRLNFTML